MALQSIVYKIYGKKKKINVQVLTSPLQKFRGLMFKKTSPPLLFVFNREKNLSIHSFFCRPFIAIWLDTNFKATKITKINKWRPFFTGRGRYLLEIPQLLDNGKSPSEK